MLAVLCFLCIGLYVFLFRHTVAEHERGVAYYPLWVSGDIKTMVERAGSRESAIERYGIAAVRKSIDEMGAIPLAATSVLLLLVYQGIFTSLTIAFGLPGIHANQPLMSPDSRREQGAGNI